MDNLDLILEIVKEIKVDMKEIKDNYVKKEDCFTKHDNDNNLSTKAITIICGTISSAMATLATIATLIINNNMGK